MKITLEPNEVESIIKEHYDGIEDITYDDNNNIILIVDKDKFKKKAFEEPAKLKPISFKETIKQQAKPTSSMPKEENVMASGGVERNLVRF